MSTSDDGCILLYRQSDPALDSFPPDSAIVPRIICSTPMSFINNLQLIAYGLQLVASPLYEQCATKKDRKVLVDFVGLAIALTLSLIQQTKSDAAPNSF
jgi:hypothetical protein